MICGEAKEDSTLCSVSTSQQSQTPLQPEKGSMEVGPGNAEVEVLRSPSKATMGMPSEEVTSMVVDKRSDTKESNFFTPAMAVEQNANSEVVVNKAEKLKTKTRTSQNQVKRNEQVAEQNDDVDAASSELPENATALILRHLPRHLSEAELMQEVNAQGFQGLYDFLSVPRGRRGGRGPHGGSRSTAPPSVNLGYAIVNFEQRKDANRFKDVFQGHFFGGGMAPCAISPASVQGAPNLAKEFRRPAAVHRRGHRGSGIRYPRGPPHSRYGGC